MVFKTAHNIVVLLNQSALSPLSTRLCIQNQLLQILYFELEFFCGLSQPVSISLVRMTLCLQLNNLCICIVLLSRLL
jgi:hypothetical protein